jgi:DNA-binding transcriptional MerR regulator
LLRARETAYSSGRAGALVPEQEVRSVAEMTEIPQKRFYKISEVCQYTDTQPYVVRFWESEFPQLSPEKSRSGQSVYSRDDIELILRIKQLLYDEEYTLDGARRCLAHEAKRSRKGSKGGKAAPAARRKQPARKAAKEAAGREKMKEVDAPAPADADDVPPARTAPQPLEFDTVPRERYEDAVDEIAHLRMQIKELESKSRKAEGQLEKLGQTADAYRRRCEKAATELERLLGRLE